MKADNGSVQGVTQSSQGIIPAYDPDTEIVAVLWTPWGGVNHNVNHYRTLHWNTVTGRLALRAEYNHGLWKEGAYWWCRVGEALANGDIRAQLERPGNNDAAELANDGFTPPPTSYWAYRLENIVGFSPFTRIQVRNTSHVAQWHTVVPTATHPVSAWIYGQRPHPHHAGEVYVALSHAQLEALNGSPIPADHDSVLVDMGMVKTNIGPR